MTYISVPKHLKELRVELQTVGNTLPQYLKVQRFSSCGGFGTSVDSLFRNSLSNSQFLKINTGF